VQRGALIGQGAFGKVFKGEWQGVEVAMKTVTRVDKLAELKEEAIILQQLMHPHIVQFIGLFQDPVEDTVYIVTEFMPEGSLDLLLRTPSSREILTLPILLKMGRDVAAGMLQLGEKDIVHCDLACRNLLVTTQRSGYVIKVTDFGLSRIITGDIHSAASNPLLPIKWSAPEAIAGEEVTSKSDVWSYGVTLWEILNYGELPYREFTNREAYDWIMAGNRLSIPDDTPEVIEKMLQRCWLIDPSQRPSFREILATLDSILRIETNETSSYTLHLTSDPHIYESAVSPSSPTTYTTLSESESVYDTHVRGTPSSINGDP